MKIIIENLIKEDLLMSSDLDLWTRWQTNDIVSLLLCYFNLMVTLSRKLYEAALYLFPEDQGWSSSQIQS